jgi:hypothetical protein
MRITAGLIGPGLAGKMKSQFLTLNGGAAKSKIFFAVRITNAAVIKAKVISLLRNLVIETQVAVWY